MSFEIAFNLNATQIASLIRFCFYNFIHQNTFNPSFFFLKKKEAKKIQEQHEPSGRLFRLGCVRNGSGNWVLIFVIHLVTI